MCMHVYMYEYAYVLYVNVCVAFTMEEFLEVDLEIWHEWDSNPRPLNSLQKISELSGNEFNSHLEFSLVWLCTINPLFTVRI